MKKLQVSPHIVTRFVTSSLLSLKPHSPSRGTPDLAVALQKSCVAWKRNVLHVEDLRTRLRQLPSSSSDAGEQLPRALHVYDEASAIARADYVGFLQTSRGFAQSYVDAVVERMRFQNGALELLSALLEMARQLRGEAVQLKISFKRGPCKQFKCVVKEVNSKPLPFDADVLKDIDVSLKDIKAAYQLLDDFWVTELESLSKTINTVHIDRARVERWLGYKDALEETISNWKSAGTLTKDRAEDVEMDADTQIPAASDFPAIAKHLRPHMTTAGSLLHTMRDHVSPADIAPIQVAIFGLQQSQQQCLSFFSECVKYWEKAKMRCEVSIVRPTLEKLVNSQRLLAENLDQAPDKAQLAIRSLRNAIAYDDWSTSPRERSASSASGAADLRLRFGPEGADDMIRRLRSLDDPGYDPFMGMSLEELGRERQKWTTCRKFFESELRACEASPSSGPPSM
ncbi:hypothetical protein BJV78DRAFT_1285313 [Lactifluus subvellereus]|nr:hypothetical protein BJV78DRAFT_1285313 [Lactifluus subvellereus]